MSKPVPATLSASRFRTSGSLLVLCEVENRRRLVLHRSPASAIGGGHCADTDIRTFWSQDCVGHGVSRSVRDQRFGAGTNGGVGQCARPTRASAWSGGRRHHFAAVVLSAGGNRCG